MKRSSLLLLLIIISFSATAQKQKIIALSNYDYKKFHFGMSLDFGFFNLVNDYTSDFQNHPDILSIETDGDVGLGVSFILPDLRLNKRSFSFSIVPSAYIAYILILASFQFLCPSKM